MNVFKKLWQKLFGKEPARASTTALIESFGTPLKPIGPKNEWVSNAKKPVVKYRPPQPATRSGNPMRTLGPAPVVTRQDDYSDMALVYAMLHSNQVGSAPLAPAPEPERFTSGGGGDFGGSGASGSWEPSPAPSPSYDYGSSSSSDSSSSSSSDSSSSSSSDW